jgi:hypothetical protein
MASALFHNQYLSKRGVQKLASAEDLPVGPQGGSAARCVQALIPYQRASDLSRHGQDREPQDRQKTGPPRSEHRDHRSSHAAGPCQFADVHARNHPETKGLY